MGDNLVTVEPQVLEADLGGMEAKEGDYVSACDALRKCVLGEKIGAYGGVGVGMV